MPSINRGKTYRCAYAHLEVYVHSTRLDAIRRGKEMLFFYRDENEGTYRSGEGRGGPTT